MEIYKSFVDSTKSLLIENKNFWKHLLRNFVLKILIKLLTKLDFI